MPENTAAPALFPTVARVGCAGWGIPGEHAGLFPGEGTHLARYALRFGAVEINSSFYRPHQAATYARWAGSTPPYFRFAVKMPKAITHTGGLAVSVELTEALDRFLSECGALGPKLGPLLVQLPPSRAFDAGRAGAFFDLLRERFPEGGVVCEPRHATWFSEEAEALLERFCVARVAADPALVPQAAVPGGWPGLVYFRLHGSPRVYYSAYSASLLDARASDVAAARGRGAEAWCIFDNTAAGAATVDALRAHDSLSRYH